MQSKKIIEVVFTNGTKAFKSILPFITMPEVILVARSICAEDVEVFIPEQRDGKYYQTSWAIAYTSPEAIAQFQLKAIKLQLKDGTFVCTVYIRHNLSPQVVIWGSRIFKVVKPEAYEEIFYALADDVNSAGQKNE